MLMPDEKRGLSVLYALKRNTNHYEAISRLFSLIVTRDQWSEETVFLLETIAAE